MMQAHAYAHTDVQHLTLKLSPSEADFHFQLLQEGGSVRVCVCARMRVSV